MAATNNIKSSFAEPAVYINASEVAAAAGLNNYCKPEKLMKKIKDRKKGKKEQPVKDVLSELPATILADLEKEVGTVSDLYSQINEDVDKIVDDNVAVSQLLVNLEKKAATSESKEVVTAIESLKVAVQTEVRTRVGTKSEKMDLKEDVDKGILDEIITDNKIKYGCYQLPDGNFIKIGGRIDGKLKDGTIVESKHRSYKLFQMVPKYERVQCEVYMRLCNVDKCLHIQHFAGESDETELFKDDELWGEVLERLVYFITLL